MTTISVFGGTGFLGRRVVKRLVAEGANVRVVVRHPDLVGSALGVGMLERLTVIRADIGDQSSVASAVAGAHAVVNAVSAYVEKDGVTFESVHVTGAETLARESASAGVARFVLVSGIGADPDSSSCYISARGRGEIAVRRVFPGATIVRPSAIFGPGDALFGTLTEVARFLPILPLIGCGRARVQPVYVEDVVDAIACTLADPGTAGRTYETAGPRVYTWHELMTLALSFTGRRRLLVPVPFFAARNVARLFELLPQPPITTGQVDLLEDDNVASGNLPGLQELSIQPKSVEEVVPTYIGRSRVFSRA